MLIQLLFYQSPEVEVTPVEEVEDEEEYRGYVEEELVHIGILETTKLGDN